MVFLGAYVAVYSAIVMAGYGVGMLTDRLSGGRDIAFWYAFGPWISLIPDLLFEPLRMCLLAVAFRRCLELFWAKSHEEAGDFPDPLELGDPMPVGHASTPTFPPASTPASTPAATPAAIPAPSGGVAEGPR